MRIPCLLVGLFLAAATARNPRQAPRNKKKYLLCHEYDSHVCQSWILSPRDLENNDYFISNRYKACGLSDLHPIRPNKHLYKISSLKQDSLIIPCRYINIVNDYKTKSTQTPRRHKRSPRGKFRGQTQSQYLSIDQNKGNGDEGKAEALSAADSSRAIVSGRSGMGQAQSQTMYDPSCDDCYNENIPQSLRDKDQHSSWGGSPNGLRPQLPVHFGASDPNYQKSGQTPGRQTDGGQQPDYTKIVDPHYNQFSPNIPSIGTNRDHGGGGNFRPVGPDGNLGGTVSKSGMPGYSQVGINGGYTPSKSPGYTGLESHPSGTGATQPGSPGVGHNGLISSINGYSPGDSQGGRKIPGVVSPGYNVYVPAGYTPQTGEKTGTIGSTGIPSNVGHGFEGKFPGVNNGVGSTGRFPTSTQEGTPGYPQNISPSDQSRRYNEPGHITGSTGIGNIPPVSSDRTRLIDGPSPGVTNGQRWTPGVNSNFNNGIRSDGNLNGLKHPYGTTGLQIGGNVNNMKPGMITTDANGNTFICCPIDPHQLNLHGINIQTVGREKQAGSLGPGIQETFRPSGIGKYDPGELIKPGTTASNGQYGQGSFSPGLGYSPGGQQETYHKEPRPHGTDGRNQYGTDGSAIGSVQGPYGPGGQTPLDPGSTGTYFSGGPGTTVPSGQMPLRPGGESVHRPVGKDVYQGQGAYGPGGQISHAPGVPTTYGPSGQGPYSLGEQGAYRPGGQGEYGPGGQGAYSPVGQGAYGPGDQGIHIPSTQDVYRPAGEGTYAPGQSVHGPGRESSYLPGRQGAYGPGVQGAYGPGVQGAYGPSGPSVQDSGDQIGQGKQGTSGPGVHATTGPGGLGTYGPGRQDGYVPSGQSPYSPRGQGNNGIERQVPQLPIGQAYEGKAPQGTSQSTYTPGIYGSYGQGEPSGQGGYSPGQGIYRPTGQGPYVTGDQGTYGPAGQGTYRPGEQGSFGPGGQGSYGPGGQGTFGSGGQGAYEPMGQGGYRPGQGIYELGVDSGRVGTDSVKVQPTQGAGQGGVPQNVLDPNAIDSDDDSEALATVNQGGNGTVASASSKGGNEKGRAQTQVQGTYSGSGSFSAQAQITDDRKGAESQVTGSKEGASSSAQGRGRNNKSQAQVELGSETGSVQTNAQSEGVMHSSNSQVQGGVKGGMADAQARGPGSTSSQAQIGFTPFKEGDKSHDQLKTPFYGGGSASAQSSGRTGQSQSQLQGTFKYGIQYNGAAQAGASINKDTVFPNRLPFNKIDVFDETNKNIDVNANTIDTSTPIADKSTSTETIDHSDTKTNGHSHSVHHSGGTQSPINSRRSFHHNRERGNEYEYTTNKFDNTSDDYDAEGSFGAEGVDAEPEYANYDDFNHDLTHQPLQSANKKGLDVKQSSGGSTQHIILGSLRGHDAEITQHSSEQRPDESRIYQPGERVPGTGGYTIPLGFTGSVKSVASKSKTYAIGSKDSPSQAQTVALSPGTGKVKYVYSKPNPISPKDLKSLLPKKNDDNRYMSVSKSVSGALDGDNNIKKQYSHTYYTKSSSCGYFTFTCTIVSGSNGRKKVCKPKIPTNPDGTPMNC